MSTRIYSSFENANPTKFHTMLVLASTLVVAIFVSAGALAAQEDVPEYPEFKPSSKTIKKFGEAFDMVKLSSDGLKLKPAYEEDRQAGRDLFSKVRSGLSSTSSGSSSSGNSRWSCYLSSSGFKGAVGMGLSSQYRLGGDEQFWVFLEDTENDSTLAQIEVHKKGSISVNFSTNGGASIFRFRQKSDGKVYCQDLTGESAFVSGAKNYDDFCRRHPEFVRKRLEPVFKYIGLGVPPSRYADEVAKNVIVELQPVEDSRMKEFKAAIDGLNAKSFDEREAAMKPLEENFDKWRDLIQATINDDKFSVETRVRLKKIFKKSATSEEVNDLEIAQKGKLEEDPAYLIWLFEKVEAGELEASKDIKKLLVKRIEELTGQTHGEDLEKWQTWVGKANETDAKPPEPTLTDKEILGFKGSLEKASGHIGKLVRLKLDEGRLKIDRAHWAKPFKGKSISELANEVEELIGEANLPKGWFSAGGKIEQKYVDHPQVLFELMQEEFSQSHSSLSHSRSYSSARYTLNRKFTTSDFEASLRFHGDSRNTRSPKKKFFDLTINEIRRDPKRKLQVRESADGTMILNLEIPKHDAMIRMVQASDKKSKNRFVLFDLRGEVVKVLRAESFEDFKNKEKEYYDSILSPLMNKFNIKIDQPGGDSKSGDETKSDDSEL